MAEKSSNTIWLLLAAGAGVWIYLYYKQHGAFPWQAAPSVLPSAGLGVSTTPTLSNTPSNAQTVIPSMQPGQQTITPTTAEGSTDGGPGIQVVDTVTTTGGASVPVTIVKDPYTGNMFATLASQGKIQTLTKPVQVTGVTTRCGRLGNICG